MRFPFSTLYRSLRRSGLFALALLLAALLAMPVVDAGSFSLDAASGSGKYGDGRDDDSSGSNSGDDDWDDNDDWDGDDDWDDDDDWDEDRSGSNSDDDGDDDSSGSSGSDDAFRSGTSSSNDDNSSGNDSGVTQTTTRSTRERIEGKTRAIIDGFQAEFSVRLERRFDRVKFRAEVSNLNRPAGSAYQVCYEASSLGGIILNSLRFGELELDSRLGQTIPDFAGGELIELREGACGGALVMSATLGSAPASGGGEGTPKTTTTSTQTESRIEGKTRNFINGFQAEFNIRYEEREDRRKFRAEAESLNLGAGTRLDVCSAGAFLGDIMLNNFNFGELELDSRFVSNVPVFAVGDTVDLRLGGCDGELVMAATFGGETVQPGNPQQELEGKTRAIIGGFEAEFQVRFEQLFDRRKIRAEVSNLNMPVGTLLRVCLGSQSLGEITLNEIRFAELELDSRLGQVVPTLETGDIVDLRTTMCGAVDGTLLSVSIN